MRKTVFHLLTCVLFLLANGNYFSHGWSNGNPYEEEYIYDTNQRPSQLSGDFGNDYQQRDNNEFEDFQIPSQSYTTEKPAIFPTGSPSHSPIKNDLSQQLQVSSPVGIIQGTQVRLPTGKTVYAFLGIPFARPPVGDLRFKRPVPADIFHFPYNATQLPNACIQQSFEIFEGFKGEQDWNPNTNISEDCLYLNIWVPENKRENLSSVLFWIYGGGFFSGSSSLDIYNGASLAGNENVIVVSSQYRLGPLGFLFFPGSNEAPGNVGLWDQNLALKWTHDNIESFGGDKNSITLFGESCGAVSVSYHLLSTASKNLFNRAVMMSAATETIYGFSPPHILKTRSYKLAKLAGCDIGKPPGEIVECLRSKDPLSLTELQWSLTESKMLEFVFKPTIDGKFIDDFPTNIIKSGKAKRADLMIGSVEDEGSYFVLYQYLELFKRDNPTSVSYDKFTEIMKDIFGGEFSRIELHAIISHYTNWDNPEDGLINQQLISEAVGDFYFVCPVRKFANLWSNRALNLYYYHFTQRSSSNPWAKWMGVMHGDEIEYFFGHPQNNSKYTPGEQQLSSHITRMLTNFAKTGIPSENWGRYSTEVPIYLDLNATIPSDETNPNKFGPRASHCAFWIKVLPQIRQTLNRQQQQCSQGSNFRQRQSFNGRGMHEGQGFHSSNYCNCTLQNSDSSKNFEQSSNNKSSGFGQKPSRNNAIPV